MFRSFALAAATAAAVALLLARWRRRAERRPHLWVLDTDLGYDPDDIPALVMVIRHCQRGQLCLAVITSAERYSHRSSIGQRARVIRAIARAMHVRVVRDANLLTPGANLMLISGEPSHVRDAGAAKSRQYHQFRKLYFDDNYEQSVAPTLLRALTVAPEGDIVRREDALPVLRTLLAAHEAVTWVGIGAMTNLDRLVAALSGDAALLARITIFQQGLSAPSVKKFASTNLALDPYAAARVHRDFPGALYYVSSGLTGTYTWTTQHDEANGALSLEQRLANEFCNATRELLDATRCWPFAEANIGREVPALAYDDDDDAIIPGQERFGREWIGQYVIYDRKTGDEVPFLLGGSAAMDRRARASTVARIAEALLPSVVWSAETIAAFVDTVAEGEFSGLEAFADLAALIYAKPTPHFPFASNFHDPITVAFAARRRRTWCAPDTMLRVRFDLSGPNASLRRVELPAGATCETLGRDVAAQTEGELVVVAQPSRSIDEFLWSCRNGSAEAHDSLRMECGWRPSAELDVGPERWMASRRFTETEGRELAAFVRSLAPTSPHK